MRSVVVRVALWLARYGLMCLAVLAVLAAFVGACWLFVSEGPWWWAALWIAVAAVLALKALYEVTEPLERISRSELHR